MFSNILSKEFYIDPIRELLLEGIPCYSFREIQEMKEKGITEESLRESYERKLKEGEFMAAVGSVFDPQSELGHEKVDLKEARKTRSEMRSEEARRWCAQIREELSKAKP